MSSIKLIIGIYVNLCFVSCLNTLNFFAFKCHIYSTSAEQIIRFVLKLYITPTVVRGEVKSTVTNERF
jgi:uncharacterized membrane protein